MVDKKKLKELEKIIKPILINYSSARSDDYLLYAKVIEKYYPEIKDAGLIYALHNHTQLGLPNWESVTRIRRKIQQDNPELAKEKVKLNREKQTVEYLQYVR